MRSYNSLATIYVGNGNLPDGLESVGSLNDAFREIIELRRSGVGQPVTIKMTAGEYSFAKPLEINEKLTAVTIEPYDNDSEVVFSGSKRITGFEKTTFNGVDCFGVFIPEVKSGEWYFTDLYVDGERAFYTRYPSEGTLEILSVEDNSAYNASSKWFTLNPDEITCIKDLKNVIVSLRHYWVDEHSPIEEYDSTTGKLTLKKRSRYNMMTKTDCYFENVRETFGKPNEWYLDPDNGMLYYMPRCECQTPENIIVYAPLTDVLVNITGKPDKPVKHIRFKNIKFAYTRGDYDVKRGVHGEEGEVYYASDGQGVSNARGTINLEYAEYCSFNNCKIMNYGIHGMDINKGCNHISVTDTIFYDGGAGGIKITGAAANGSEVDITHSNIIRNNIIYKCGRRHMSGCGILMMHTHSNTIEHNDIHDLYYTGISGGWVWGYSDTVSRDNIINKNHIYDLGQGLLSDMGGVYLLGAQPGTIISNNLIHDITSRDYGGWALYTDEGSGFMILENNVCYNTSDNCYHQHYGRMNVVRNNIFAFSKQEILRVSRFEKHLSIIFENNILYSNGSEIYGLNKRHFTNSTVGSGNNLIYSTNGDPVMNKEFATLEEVQRFGMDNGSLIADPCFVDADNFDFTLKEESPAFGLGFKPIDTSDVGSSLKF